jgi:hypothetical protein
MTVAEAVPASHAIRAAAATAASPSIFRCFTGLLFSRADEQQNMPSVSPVMS